MKFSTAIYSIGAVLVVHAILMMSEAYYLFKNIDIIMHLLGGFVIAMLALAIFDTVLAKKSVSIPWWFKYLFVSGFVMLIGVAWEWHEFLIDVTLTKWYELPRSQLSLADTMFDFFNDWFGATICFLIFKFPGSRRL